jgi:Methyltransferase domain
MPSALISTQTFASRIRDRYRSLRSHAAALGATVPMLPRVAWGVANGLLNRSDYVRWSDDNRLESWWEARTAQLARHVPAGSRVIEFGAGRGWLPKYLDACAYFPSDLVPRAPGTIVCDLNKRPLPDLRHLNLDVAVFCGVLEYITNLPALTQWLSTQVTTCVASYDGVDSPRGSADRVLELGRRKTFGYMNSFEPGRLVAVFEQAGFRCACIDRWESQEIYVFTLVSPESGVDAVADHK